jgi:hypothetical protein
MESGPVRQEVPPFGYDDNGMGVGNLKYELISE